MFAGSARATCANFDGFPLKGHGPDRSGRHEQNQAELSEAALRETAQPWRAALLCRGIVPLISVYKPDSSRVVPDGNASARTERV